MQFNLATESYIHQKNSGNRLLCGLEMSLQHCVYWVTNRLTKLAFLIRIAPVSNCTGMKHVVDCFNLWLLQLAMCNQLTEISEENSFSLPP